MDGLLGDIVYIERERSNEQLRSDNDGQSCQDDGAARRWNTEQNALAPVNSAEDDSEEKEQ